MKQTKSLLGYVLLLIVASSCSIEKRVYTSGYHIEWNGGGNKNEIPALSEANTHQSDKEPRKTIIEEKISAEVKRNNFGHISSPDRSITQPKKETTRTAFTSDKDKVIEQKKHLDFIQQQRIF